MKNLIYLLISLFFITSCNKDVKYVTFSGKISNKNCDSLVLFHPKTNYSKVIKLTKEGVFKDTLKVKNGLFSFTDSKEFALLYLINGDEVIMNYDAKSFNSTIDFKGNHKSENEFLVKSLENENQLFANRQLMSLQKGEFDSKIQDYVSKFNDRLSEKELDVDFYDFQKKEIIKFKEYLEKEYLEKNYNRLVLSKGKVSPVFENYENFKGGTTSLSDFKGKYVYIDVWATWCHPCKEEIPFLKKIEKQFHNKNIEFVSISLDDKRDYKVWKDMIVDEELVGSQLYANGDQKFINAYRVNSIPRFILIDPNGNIVDANAPRPSRNELIQLLNNLEL